MSKEDRYSHLGSDNQPDTPADADAEENSPQASSEEYSVIQEIDLEGGTVHVESNGSETQLRVKFGDGVDPEEAIAALETAADQDSESLSEPDTLPSHSVRAPSRPQSGVVAAGVAGASLGALGAALVLRRLRR